MTTNGKHPRNPNGTRPKIDWAAARSAYARDPTASFASIGRAFGVSDTAVRNHARSPEEDWDAYRADVQAAAAAKRREADIRALEKREADTIRVADRLRDLLLEGDLGDVTPKVAARVLPQYAKIERLIAGESTENVSQGDLQAVFRELAAELMAVFGEERAEELAGVLQRVAARVAAAGETAVGSDSP